MGTVLKPNMNVGGVTDYILRIVQMTTIVKELNACTR